MIPSDVNSSVTFLPYRVKIDSIECDVSCRVEPVALDDV